MHILFLALDYPPRPADATADLPRALAALDAQVTVVCQDGAPVRSGPVRVLRAVEPPPLVADFDRSAWVLQANLACFERAATAALEDGFDVVHAEGWPVAHAAIGVARAFGIPLVARLGARPPRGLPAETERWLGAEADRVIAASPASLARAGVGPGKGTVARSARRTAAIHRAVAGDARPLRTVARGRA